VYFIKYILLGCEQGTYCNTRLVKNKAKFLKVNLAPLTDIGIYQAIQGRSLGKGVTTAQWTF
jgi:hypothetical protein